MISGIFFFYIGIINDNKYNFANNEVISNASGIYNFSSKNLTNSSNFLITSNWLGLFNWIPYFWFFWVLQYFLLIMNKENPLD